MEDTLFYEYDHAARSNVARMDEELNAELKPCTCLASNEMMNLQTIIHVDANAVEHLQGKAVDVPIFSGTLSTQSQCKGVSGRRQRESYRRYTAHQIERLFDLVIEEGKTAKDAALIVGINVRTTQHYVKAYNNDRERRLPDVQKMRRSGRCAKLTEAHSRLLVDYISKNPASILVDIQSSLCKAFEGLTISISALHRHLVKKCHLTLKKLEKQQRQETLTELYP